MGQFGLFPTAVNTYIYKCQEEPGRMYAKKITTVETRIGKIGGGGGFIVPFLPQDCTQALLDVK